MAENGKISILTPRQIRVAVLVTEGLTNREIAERIGNTEYTIKNKVREIFNRTGMSTRLELALWYLAHSES